MLLFPYRADVELNRVSVLTILVCVICVAVFAQQAWSEHAYREAISRFCSYEISRNEQIVASYLPDADGHYCVALLRIRKAADQDAAIRTMAEASRPIPFYANRADGIEYVYGTLLD